jgi:hypothetical protein
MSSLLKLFHPSDNTNKMRLSFTSLNLSNLSVAGSILPAFADGNSSRETTTQGVGCLQLFFRHCVNTGKNMS